MEAVIDLAQILEESSSEGEKSRVQIRYENLINTMPSQEIDRSLRAKALEESPSTSLNDVIKDLVKVVAYGQARLSLPEFIERFRKNKLADLIASRFANSLAVLDSEENPVSREALPVESDEWDEKTLEANKVAVLRQILIFLETTNLTSSDTLYAKCRKQKTDYPMVNISTLFLEEYPEKNLRGEVVKMTLREKVSRKIDNSLETIATQAYEEKFNEDKKGFVMGYMLGRVIKYNHQSKKMDFHEKEFRSLMEYLDGLKQSILKVKNQNPGENVPDQSLYEMLYEDSRGMAKYLEDQHVTALTGNVKSALERIGLLERRKEAAEDKLFFEEGFDVKAFYDKHIRPAIFKFYSRKLRKLKKTRPVDLLHKVLDSHGLGRANYTSQLRRYVKALIETKRQNPEHFMTLIRELLGLEASPLYPDLSDEDVKAHVHLYLNRVSTKFRQTVSEALHYRQDTEIHQACVYPDPLLDCRDLSKLLEWFMYPDIFKQEYPEYQGVPNDQVGFMAGTILRDFLNVMNTMSKKVFINAGERRDLHDRSLKNSLQISEIKEIQVKFRTLEMLDDNEQPLKPPVYDLALDMNEVGDFMEGVDPDLSNMVMKLEGTATIKWKDKVYRIHEEETKNFKKVKISIPVMFLNSETGAFEQGPRHEATVLIYSGDQSLIHLKDKITRVTSKDRGKEVSDESRWMMAFSNKEDANKFKDFLYNKHPLGLIKVEDTEEGRFLSNKINGAKKAESTEEFKKFQDFVYTLTLAYPEKGPDGTIQIREASLETQSQKLKEMLLNNLSEFTSASHQVFRAERAWPLLCNNYFPPEFFGDRYKELFDQGYEFEVDVPEEQSEVGET
jgi:hypothetical protein